MEALWQGAFRVFSSVRPSTIRRAGRRAAEVQQRGLLPERLPDVPGIQATARYLPGGDGSLAGGDWHDLIPLPGGLVGIAMGDVVGKGAEAAALMGRLRTATRAYALDGHTPAAIAERLNRVVLGAREQDRVATFFYGELDPRDGRLRYTSAGHLAPLVLSPSGSTSMLHGARSVPLGVLADGCFTEANTILAGGAILTLFTDGLVETPDGGIGRDLARLQAAAAGPVDGPGELCERLLSRLLPPGGGSDDVAVLAVQTAPRPVRIHARRFAPDAGATAPGEVSAG